MYSIVFDAERLQHLYNELKQLNDAYLEDEADNGVGSLCPEYADDSALGQLADIHQTIISQSMQIVHTLYMNANFPLVRAKGEKPNYFNFELEDEYVG